LTIKPRARRNDNEESSMHESTEAVVTTALETAQHDAPVILDLGQRSKKQVKRLRHGEGKLMDRISIVMEELKKNGTISPTAQPVVLVVREKREKGFAAMLKS
jgi:hypothetical protein